MAKNTFLLILLLTAAALHAQVKIGLLGGPQTANITEKNDIAGWDTTTGKYYSGKSGIHVGITAEIPFGGTSRFYFEPSLIYSAKGRNFTKLLQTSSADSFYSYNTTRNLTIQYIDIPLNIAYKLPLSSKKTTNFILSAGPYLSLFYDGKNITNQNDQFSSNSETRNTVVNKTEVLEVGKKDNSYRTVGYGVNARAGFELGNVTLTGFYSQGLDNLYYAAYKGTFKHKVYGASLGIWLGQTKEPVVVKDRDGDGVTDDKDACPLLPGAAITQGCPDKDGDGIADKNDKCPDAAGTVKYKGCPLPDADHDGISDETDKCPLVAGLARYQGCPIPDTDKDGINDEEDKCPTVFGVVRYKGCAVPDRDKDGINDEDDRCPDVAGTYTNNGCPLVKEALKKQVNFAAENIFFSTNSALLLNKSFAALDTIAAILKNNPAIVLSVDGYTDNTGSESANQSISAQRAMAVKDYLVKNGINDSRISTHGYGPANPIADNATAAGRGRNRRVEIRLQ